MSKVDWSLAPDDASHARDYQRGVDFYKRESSLWMFWDRNKWDVAVGTPERDCIERPQPKPWSGPEDGLPPVNTVCDLRMKDGGWGDAVIKYISATQCVWLWLNGNPDQREWSSEPWKMDFRPIRTAAEKRETAIRELMDIAQVDCRVTAARLVDAGFKREVV